MLPLIHPSFLTIHDIPLKPLIHPSFLTIHDIPLKPFFIPQAFHLTPREQNCENTTNKQTTKLNHLCSLTVDVSDTHTFTEAKCDLSSFVDRWCLKHPYSQVLFPHAVAMVTK